MKEDTKQTDMTSADISERATTETTEKLLSESSSGGLTGDRKPSAGKSVLPEGGIPCPAVGDCVVFCPNVDAFVASQPGNCKKSGGSDGVRYAIIEMPENTLQYVIMVPDIEEAVEITLKEAFPGFDSIAIWSGMDKDLRTWQVFVHFPVSGRIPVPESCVQLIHPSDLKGRLFNLDIQAYTGKKLTTLRTWRENHEHIPPNVILQKITRIGKMFKSIFATGHTLLRVSPDNLVLEDDEFRLLGALSFDLPWNERCATDHVQAEYAPIPPECFGFVRHRMTEAECVYLLGSFAYFLIAGAQVPTCEMLGYEPALPARAFHPSFPIGWEAIILQALAPNPEFRFKTIDQFLKFLSKALGDMVTRRDFHKSVQYDAAIDTHIGVGKRLRCPVNQDAVFLRATEDNRRMLIVVADGVSTSTYGSGDIASGIVVDTAQSFWEDHLKNAETLDANKEVSEILKTANRATCQYIVERYADKSPQSSDCMGTTALVAIIDNGELTLASTGDSRAYMIRKDLMECITRDHNLFTVGILSHVPVEYCAAHPHAGSLVQCLGYYEEDEELSFDIFSMRLCPGDILLMTTDGILDYIAPDIVESEKKIADIVLSDRDAKAVCEELIAQANLGGGGDNCGVAVVKVSG